MEQNQKEQQNYEFTKKQREKILGEEFNVGKEQNKCNKQTLKGIIDGIIDAIKDDNYCKNCIKKYWFTKQIEERKKDGDNKDKESHDDELMDIVKEDLKIRMANTMLALEKRTDIDKKNIWFDQNGEYVVLRHNDDKICEVSNFNNFYYHLSPPYKPFFMTNKSDDDKLNGVCIYKHGNDKKKTKWIMACFKDNGIVPQCKITFQTNNNKIINVKIENKKDEDSESIYTISLNNGGQVEKITKEGEEYNQNKNYYNNEIKQLLFENETNKVLIERIEDELDSQQKQVFDNIKEYLDIEKDTKEENKDNTNNQNIINEKEEENENSSLQSNPINNPEAKYKLCEWNNNICGFKESGGFGCCGW